MPGGIRGSDPRRRGASGKPGGGLARREPGSGVRPGGSPVRTSGAEGTQLGDRGGARCGGGCGAQPLTWGGAPRIGVSRRGRTQGLPSHRLSSPPRGRAQDSAGTPALQ